MKTKLKSILAAALSAGGLAAFAAVPQAITYRGVLTRTSGYDRPMMLELTFRLYDSKAPEKALWARSMSVPVATNAVFYAELSDANGSDPDGIGSTLADAMAAIKGTPEIGLTPPRAAELSPRQALSTQPRAARAVWAKAADTVWAASGAGAESVFVGTATVGDVTVQPGAALAVFPARCTLLKKADADGSGRTLGGGENSTVTVRDVTVAPPIGPTAFTDADLAYVTKSAPSDMILTYEDEDGAFNAIVPEGGRIEGADARVKSVCGTAFGNR